MISMPGTPTGARPALLKSSPRASIAGSMADIRSTNAELRALAAQTPRRGDLGLTDLVARVFAGGTAELRSEDGAELEVERVAVHRALASVLAPRLALEPRLLVTGGCNAPDPWAVTFVVHEVKAYSPSTDEVVLEAVQSSLYPERRRDPRVETGGEAIVTVHHGVEMVEQERHRAVLVNLSAGGVAFATGAEIAVGGQVTVDARMMAGRLRMDVQVRWRGTSRVPGMHVYGCRALRACDASATIVANLLQAAPAAVEPPAGVSVAELQRIHAQQRRRRLFGRRRDG
jgi:hypothetical protein